MMNSVHKDKKLSHVVCLTFLLTQVIKKSPLTERRSVAGRRLGSVFHGFGNLLKLSLG